jgi:hypothetical protein
LQVHRDAKHQHTCSFPFQSFPSFITLFNVYSTLSSPQKEQSSAIFFFLLFSALSISNPRRFFSTLSVGLCSVSLLRS